MEMTVFHLNSGRLVLCRNYYLAVLVAFILLSCSLPRTGHDAVSRWNEVSLLEGHSVA